MIRIVGLNGSLSLRSRTGELLRSLLLKVSDGRSIDIETVDIAALVTDLGIRSRAEASQGLAAALTAVENADLLIVATPVYKGSYPGLFKHFIDLVGPDALYNRPVGLVATGGGQRHALVVEHQLRPLFGFFSARTLPTSLFIANGEFVDGSVRDAALASRLDTFVSEAIAALPESLRSQEVPSARFSLNHGDNASRDSRFAKADTAGNNPASFWRYFGSARKPENKT